MSDLDDLTALPVALEVAGAMAARLRDHVEGTLGWQVTGAGGLPPVLTLTDGSAPVTAGPAVGVVAASATALQVAALASTVDRVVVWPEQAADLPAIARSLRQRTNAPAGHVPLVVGGASGGVGTSTIAAALAGITAWAGHETLLIVGPGSPFPDALPVGGDALRSTQLWPAAGDLSGMTGLRAVQLDRPWATVGAPLLHHRAVADAGVDLDVDVLVLRRDRTGVEALRSTRAGAAVVLDEGIAPRRVIADAADGRLLVPVARSARVARAHAARRLPAALPGRWLDDLRPLVESR